MRLKIKRFLVLIAMGICRSLMSSYPDAYRRHYLFPMESLVKDILADAAGGTMTLLQAFGGLILDLTWGLGREHAASLRQTLSNLLIDHTAMHESVARITTFKIHLAVPTLKEMAGVLMIMIWSVTLLSRFADILEGPRNFGYMDTGLPINVASVFQADGIDMVMSLSCVLAGVAVLGKRRHGVAWAALLIITCKVLGAWASYHVGDYVFSQFIANEAYGFVFPFFVLFLLGISGLAGRRIQPQ